MSRCIYCGFDAPRLSDEDCPNKENINKMKIECGHRKWSVEIGENREVIIRFNHYPNIGEIKLYDASTEDFYNLGHLFSNFNWQLEVEASTSKKK